MTNDVATALVLALQTIVQDAGSNRLNEVIDDMIEVVDDESKNFEKTIDRETSLKMLAAVVTIESGYRKDVETCTVAGDGGRSIGLGQVMSGQNWLGHTRSEICKDRKFQLKLALGVINKCWRRTPHPRPTFRCYASGNAAVDSSTARRESSVYYTLEHAIDKSKKTRADVKCMRGSRLF